MPTWLFSVVSLKPGPEGGGGHEARRKGRRHQPVRRRSLRRVRYVGHVREHHTEGHGKHTGYWDHSKVPPVVDLHQGDGGTREEYSYEEKELPAPDIWEGPNQGRGEEGEETLDTNNEPVHEKGVVWESIVEHGDHWWGEEPPGEELEEDNDQGVVDARLP